MDATISLLAGCLERLVRQKAQQIRELDEQYEVTGLEVKCEARGSDQMAIDWTFHLQHRELRGARSKAKAHFWVDDRGNWDLNFKPMGF